MYLLHASGPSAAFISIKLSARQVFPSIGQSFGFAVVVGALVVEEEGALVVVGEGEGGGGIQASERMITRDRVRKCSMLAAILKLK